MTSHKMGRSQGLFNQFFYLSTDPGEHGERYPGIFAENILGNHPDGLRMNRLSDVRVLPVAEKGGVS